MASRTRRRNPLAIDRMFDEVVEDPHKATPPPILYHYTSWSGAEGILTTNTFWATAHDCTNDEAELQSANEIIIDVARHLRNDAVGAMVRVLDLFLEHYPSMTVAKLMTVYLACFSAARDDRQQWRNYADQGRGVCLGLRVLNEQVPKSPDLSSALMKVDYSEISWRANVENSFREVGSLLRRVGGKLRNLKLALSALYRIAAFMSISAKQERWAVEQEYRLATFVHPDANVQPHERVSSSKTIRFLPVSLRADGKLIAFAEVLIGSNQNFEDARDRLNRLLAGAGYKVGDMEYPEIVASSATL
jgi:hypothetical protein